MFVFGIRYRHSETNYCHLKRNWRILGNCVAKPVCACVPVCATQVKISGGRPIERREQEPTPADEGTQRGISSAWAVVLVASEIGMKSQRNRLEIDTGGMRG